MLVWAHYAIIVVGVLVAVSFYTLFERKIMGLSHLRPGPQLIGWWGILQPFADAVKLFTKESVEPVASNRLVFIVAPGFMLSLSVVMWSVLPLKWGLFSLKLLVVFFFVLTSVGVFTHLGSGWSSNSAYALIGALRCVAQTLSYEISLAFLFLSSVYVVLSMDLTLYDQTQKVVWLSWLLPGLAVLWWVSSVAETNRSPFDFAEGESELVSGFNVEYGSGLFAFMFIAEYASMILMSGLASVMFMGGSLGGLKWIGLVLVLMWVFVWIRISYPRSRYDKLMYFSWLLVLPVALSTIIGLTGGV